MRGVFWLVGLMAARVRKARQRRSQEAAGAIPAAPAVGCGTIEPGSVRICGATPTGAVVPYLCGKCRAERPTPRAPLTSVKGGRPS